MRQSFWLNEALAIDDSLSESLQGDVRADVCIVGGGYTGLWTALRLKEADAGLDVTLLEARRCGSGASSANAGYMVPYWVHFPLLEQLAGTEEALRLCRASADAADEIAAFATARGIDIQLQANGTLWGATCEAQAGQWRPVSERLGRHQIHPYRALDADEIRALTGVRGYVCGVLEPAGATIQPAMLARGLRAAALDRGVKIYENTPMTALGRGRPPTVVTRCGTVRAERVVLALYAWSLRIPELASALVAVRSDGMITTPQPDALERLGWRDGPALMSSHHFTEGCRTTRDGRVLFNKPGGGQVFAARVDASLRGTSRERSFMQRKLAEYFPSLDKAPVEAHWSGSIDRTRLGLPLFGHLPGHPDIFYGFGYSGRGIIPTCLGGRILSSLVLARRDEWSQCPLVRPPHPAFPPEPLKYLGGALVLRAVERADRLDHEGRRHDPLTRSLLRFKPGHWSRQGEDGTVDKAP